MRLSPSPSWIGPNPQAPPAAASLIAAPSLGTLTIKGDTRRGLAGNCAAAVQLSGVGVAAKGTTLGGATVAGVVDNSVWRVHGAAGSITAGTAGNTWSAAFTGNVAKLTVKGDFAATFAAANLGPVSISGNMNNALLLAGADLGDDAQPGGSGSNGDTFGSGGITSFSVAKNVDASVVAAGVDPVNGVWGDGDDVFVAPTASKVGSFTIGGLVNGAVPSAALPAMNQPMQAAAGPQFFEFGWGPLSVRIGGKGVYAQEPADVPSGQW